VKGNAIQQQEKRFNLSTPAPFITNAVMMVLTCWAVFFTGYKHKKDW